MILILPESCSMKNGTQRKAIIPVAEFELRVERALKRAAQKAIEEDRRFGIDSNKPAIPEVNGK